MDENDLQSVIGYLHKELTGKFGITGFGGGAGRINVYRAFEHAEAEPAVRKIVDERAPGVEVFLTPPGGPFRAT